MLAQSVRTAVAGAAMVFFSATTQAAADVPAGQMVYWHESEVGAQAPDHAGPYIAHRDFGSDLACLQGASLPKKGAAVTYSDLELPAAVDQADIVFRYARLHWRSSMVPAHVGVEITTAGGETVKGEAIFDNTGGWGYKPADWQLARVQLGVLHAGKFTLKLTGLGDDNDESTDGFFIVPRGFAVTAGELALNGVAINSDGYVGVQSPLTVRQDADPTLRVAARSFSSREAQVTATLGKTEATAVPLKLSGVDRDKNGAVLAKFEMPKLDDGAYVMVVTGGWPQCRLVVPVVFAGQFLAALDKNLAPIAAFSAELAKSKKPDDMRCAPDFEHLVEYLKTSGKTLADASSAPVDAYKQGLAAKEGVADGAALVDDARRALAQGQETMRRLQAGEDPYAGRTGDLRRAFHSAVDGQLNVYRLSVPSNYARADKVPFILFLHGGGGDENSFPDLDGGALLEELDKRGYLVAFPRYQGRDANVMANFTQLIGLLQKEYPKIDADRLYCTGLSMGGFATYTMATTHPDMFAAICCVSGTGRPDVADKLKNTATLIFQGGIDEVVPPAGARRVAARMQELGETVDLRIFPENGHDYHGVEYLKLSLDFFEAHPKK